MAIALEQVVDSLHPHGKEERERLRILPSVELVEDSNKNNEKKAPSLQDTIELGEEKVEVKEKEDLPVLKIEYGLPEDLLAGALYNSSSVHYSLAGFYQEQKPFYAANDDEEERRPQGWIMDKQEVEMMTPEEVKEAVADVQFAAASGSYGDVDYRTRERLKFSIMFDSSAFGLMERLGRVTNDVDYSRTV